MQRLKHARNRLIFVAPMLPACFVDVAEIETKTSPYPHLVGGADRDSQESLELHLRVALLAETFRDIAADRFRGPT